MIDLFAGIGGFRLGLENENFECVFSCENDPHAIEMYKKNFKDNPCCDITKLDPSKIPDFDILCAGFPCQAFSICGKQEGFYDEARGTLFFDICRVLEVKQPPIFILENVKNLATHDHGRTMSIILQSLHNLGYTVSYKVLNARDFGVPQNRERVIIVGNKDGKVFNFDKLDKTPIDSMKLFLDKEGKFEYLKHSEYTLLDDYKRQKSGLIFRGYRNKKIRKKGVRPGTMHLSRVHKQPNRIYSSEGNHPTISSSETSGRYWIYDEGEVRKLTIDECFRFFGFPEDFKKIGKSSDLYRRIGNSVCVNMIKEIAKEINNQFILNEGNYMDPECEFLEKMYTKASKLKDFSTLKLTEDEKIG
ncbi:DNA (cytosine-5-)-methyltransferase [Methanobrevibacter sp.]|uniref:DNA (cytosine-5-)-methyltransferase n=1 Tax=Methanobrevibacter sp. TaxID=66852 RepID=UPI0034CFDC41